MTITRSDLESRRFQQLIAQSGLDLHVWSEEELQTSIDETLENHPPDADLWVFAYGSLIWNPVFHHCDRQVGNIYGWHRSFCLWTPLGRGSQENPGLVLGLDRGGSCRGIAYRIATRDIATELLLMWRREMIVGSYVPRWVQVFYGEQVVRAIAFTINHQHPSYAGKLPLETVIHHIATAHGQLGPCADYLQQTVEGLMSVGIGDRYLLKLQREVAKRRSSP
jgi:cation transport protein ChaC